MKGIATCKMPYVGLVPKCCRGGGGGGGLVEKVEGREEGKQSLFGGFVEG